MQAQVDAMARFPDGGAAVAANKLQQLTCQTGWQLFEKRGVNSRMER
jgi:hypothetical protein